MILVIDNYDSFVYNLARYMELAGWSAGVARNDAITIADIERIQPEAIVISPGPCAPQQAGICIEAIRHFGPRIPILGVCLGHQCIGEAYGAKTVKAKPAHGKASNIQHDGDELFSGLPKPFKAGRYHSLVASHCPPHLTVTAQTSAGEIMAFRHNRYPTHGVQFHPESILTEHGSTIIDNFTRIALAWNARMKNAA